MSFQFQPVQDIAFRTLPEQEAYSRQQLNALLNYLHAHAPYYRKVFAETKLPLQVRDLSELALFPFTTKDDLQGSTEQFCCVSREQIREYTATSGTTGAPISIALTENDLQRLAYNEAQSFRIAGISEGDLCQLALTLDRQFMAGMAYYSGLRAIGAASVRTGPGLPELQWQTAARLRSNAIVAVPSSLVKMAEWAVADGRDPTENTIQKAICIGEPVRNPDFTLNKLGQKLRERWPLSLYSTYAATEMQTAFTECSEGRGGHLQADLLIAEIVDEAGTVLDDGKAGELVITTLGVTGMPLLRYKTGDICTLYSEPCACGRHSKRIGPVIGRKAQMIKYRGTTLFPAAILDLLAGCPYVSGSVVEVFTSDLGLDELRIHIASTLEAEECERQLRPVLQSGLRIAPALTFHSEASLAAMQMPPGARKAIRFLDHRQPGH